MSFPSDPLLPTRDEEGGRQGAVLIGGLMFAVPGMMVLGALGIGGGLALAIVVALIGGAHALAGPKKPTRLALALTLPAVALFAWIGIHELRYASRHSSGLAEVLTVGAVAGILVSLATIATLRHQAEAIEASYKEGRRHAEKDLAEGLSE